ncbi:metallophosphoesterase [Paenibacillus sp. LMG 31456]|uniref:Metallophosphoesterase n=1 Tax=Paenibacillus foliorum TaxID=2654974 RepID=A0A972H4D1_9BACL|nr:metallophosphoesterase [Paenibacillus foliorum]NOU96091.1 metallophosphoesterase [Paenibacillus foliorum]
MNRRSFVKKMLMSLAFLSAGATASIPFVRRWMVNAESGNVKFGQPHSSAQELSNTPLASFFLLSDLHISVSESSMTDRLHLALKDISAWEIPLDAIVLGGDLTDFGRASDYKLLKDILNGYTLPQLYANMGNHDYYDIWLTSKGEFSTETMPNGKTDSMARERFINFMAYYTKKPYIDVWVNDVHLIMMSQEAYVQERPEVGEGAWYSDEQLEWLRSIMQAHKDGRPAIVFIHQPLPDPGTDGGTHRVIRAKEFRAILAPYKNVFVLSGHSHRNFVGEEHYNWQNSFHWINNASVGRTRGVAGGEADPAQGLYVEVYPHQVVLRAREFSNRTWIESSEWKIPLW